MIKDGEALKPNFWRAPVDNDYGANLQRKYIAWKNPEIKLTSFKQRTENNQVIVESAYDMPGVSAKLNLVYVINNAGAVKVTQKLTADKNAKVSNMFRFGLQMPMPRSFETVEYYGRGPVENYIDRNHCADLGIYRQSVAEQFYPTSVRRKMEQRPIFVGGRCWISLVMASRLWRPLPSPHLPCTIPSSL